MDQSRCLTIWHSQEIRWWLSAALFTVYNPANVLSSWPSRCSHHFHIVHLRRSHQLCLAPHGLRRPSRPGRGDCLSDQAAVIDADKIGDRDSGTRQTSASKATRRNGNVTFDCDDNNGRRLAWNPHLPRHQISQPALRHQFPGQRSKPGVFAHNRADFWL